jgi:hypothetical protein
VNVTKEIGKFYQNKKQWNTAIGYYENRMLKVWISIWRRICFCQSYTEAKEFEKAVKKAMDMVDVFPRSLSFIIIPV